MGCDTILKAFTSTFVESHQLSVKNFDHEMKVDANLYQYDIVTGKGIKPIEIESIPKDYFSQFFSFFSLLVVKFGKGFTEYCKGHL